jgi:hypothetical protein
MTSLIAECKAGFKLSVFIPVWLGFSLVAAITGPFGTYAAVPFGQRLLFWAVLVGLSITVGTLVRAFVHGVIGWRDFWRGSGASTVLLCLLGTPALHLAVGALARGTVLDLPALVLPGVALPGLAEIGGFIFLISLGAGAFRHAMADPDPSPKPAPNSAAPNSEAPDSAATDTPAPPRLLQRIAPDQRGTLIRVAVRDHYVDVVTDRGQTSLLMRFKDAIAELDGVDGLQVHRSHWISTAAATPNPTPNTPEKPTIPMADGTHIPVSRKYRNIAKLNNLI